MKIFLRKTYPIMGFFGLKIILGVILVTLSARLRGAGDFAYYSQFFLAFVLFNLVAAGGIQNGVVREVAAALGESGAIRRTISSALALACAIGLVLLAVTALAAPWMSYLLIGRYDSASLVLLLAVCAVASGIGQVLCAVMTGLGRLGVAIGAQSMSLVAGGGLSAAALLYKDPRSAVVAYAVGMALLPIFAFVAMGASRRLMSRLPWPDLAIFKTLGHFSGAFLVTASAMPITLFVLRSFYRVSAGEKMLALWLAANRVSDVFTQLLGIYMAQIFLPAVTARLAQGTAAATIRHHILISASVMFVGVACFLAAPTFWITHFLSPAFLPGTLFISLYLVGDSLRVLPSSCLYIALARKRTGIYTLLELANAALFFGLTVSLLHFGITLGPAIAYITANLSVAVIGSFVLRGPNLAKVNSPVTIPAS